MIVDQFIIILTCLLVSIGPLNADYNFTSMTQPQVHNLQFSDPECFSEKGSSPYPCNFKGTLTSHENTPRNIQPIQTKQIILEPDDPPGDGLISGVGSYLCILRGSELGGEIFIRDVGIFRCNFEGGQRIKTNVVAGIGYYQCNYQKPGKEEIVTQGVGWYVCLFTGVYKIQGIPENLELFHIKSMDAFMEVIGSISGTFASPPQLQGQTQLLGLYQFGPEGKGLDYGFIQILEGFQFTVDDTLTPVGRSLIKKRESKALTNVNQLGTFHYSFKGTDFDRGRSQINHILGSHVIRQYGAHRLSLFVSRYDYLGKYHLYGQNKDVIQIWGYYDYDLTYGLEGRKSKDESFVFDLLQGMVITELDLEDGLINWIQLLLNLGWAYKGEDGGSGALLLTGMYQTNTERSVDDFITDLFIITFQINYILANEEGETGIFQVYGIYNYYLQLEKERAGWIQSVVQYARVYPGDSQSLWNPVGTVGTLTVTAVYEVNFPEIQFTNGFYEIIWAYAIDVGYFVEQFGWESFGLRSFQDKEKKENLIGIVTLSALYRCYVFGVAEKQKFVCYFQAYVLYQFDIEGDKEGSLGGQEVRLWAQCFQEVRNDNIVRDDMKKEREFN